MKKTNCITWILFLQALFLQAQIITPALDVLQSWEHHLELEASSIFKHLPWRSIGPISQGGRVESVVGVSGDPSIMYVGIGSGGVWTYYIRLEIKVRDLEELNFIKQESIKSCLKVENQV